MSAGDLPSKSYAMCCVLEESAIGRGCSAGGSTRDTAACAGGRGGEASEASEGESRRRQRASRRIGRGVAIGQRASCRIMDRAGLPNAGGRRRRCLVSRPATRVQPHAAVPCRLPESVARLLTLDFFRHRAPAGHIPPSFIPTASPSAPAPPSPGPATARPMAPARKPQPPHRAYYPHLSSDTDPLAAALQPPPDETPEQREQRLKAEDDARKRSENIDRMLRHDDKRNRRRKQVKVLLLGQSESGKSTTLKRKSASLLCAPPPGRTYRRVPRPVFPRAYTSPFAPLSAVHPRTRLSPPV